MPDPTIRIGVVTDADQAASGMDRVAASTDKVEGSARRAGAGIKDLGNTTGDSSQALSAFAQAASAMGLDGLAGGLNVATVALDAAEGATILFRTAMESETVAKIANSIATAANTVYTYAWVAAGIVAEATTIIWTAATTALGVAFRFLTGPIGIIITIVALLAAGIVYLYNNNETFRNIVQSVWAGVRSAISAVVSWFNATVIPAFQTLVSWSGWSTIGGLAERAFGAIKAAIDPVIGAFQTVVGWVQSAIAAISRLSIPSWLSSIGGIIGGLSASATVTYTPGVAYAAPSPAGFGGYAAPGVRRPAAGPPLTAGTAGGPGGVVVQVMVPPTGNPVETGRQIASMLRQYEANAGTSWRTG